MEKRRTAAADGPATDLTGAPPVAIMVDTVTEPPTAPPETNHVPNGNGESRKPVISWRVQSDRTTSVELACWVNPYRTQGGDEHEQLLFTVTRSYKNGDDQWVKGGSWRTHDIPVLMFLLSKAHAYALDNRTRVTPEVPF